MNEKLIYLNSLTYERDGLKKYLNNDPHLKTVSKSKAHDYCKQLSCKCVTIFDKEYPKHLKLLINPPWVLYYYGDLQLMSNYLVAILGTRTPTTYGMQATVDLVRTYQKDEVFLSGYGFGIARQAIISAVNDHKKVVCFVSRNLDEALERDQVLMHKIKENHLLIGEVPPTKQPNASCFLNRNLMLGVLADEVNVIQARANSIVLSIVETALHFGKQINALPGNVYDEQAQGTNLLLNDGANLIYLNNNQLNH